MLQFMRNNRGALSIFTLFILIPVMVLSGLLIDFARAMAVRAQAASTAETYANSYLSMYDEMLNELYGLFAVTQSEDGTKALEQLEAYMKATYATDSVGGTQLNNSNALGLQDALKRVIFGSSDYSDALPLTGNAFSAVSATVGKPLVNTANGYTDYDALQMQISEYIKFIGPTDLISSGIAGLVKPSENAAEDAANKVAETNKNFNRIKQKNDIDKRIGDLNNQITKMYEAMKNYDDTLKNYYQYDSGNKGYDGIQFYALDEFHTYKDAISEIQTTYNELKRICAAIENDGDLNGRKSELRLLLRDNLGRNTAFSNIGNCYSDNVSISKDWIIRGQALNYNKFSSHLSGYLGDIPSSIKYSYSEVVKARNDLIICAQNMDVQLDSISRDITALIKEIEADPNKDANTEDFLKGLKEEYAPLIDPSNGGEKNRQMWVIASFDYLTAFNTKFDPYAQESEANIIKAATDAFNPHNENSFTQYDTYLSERYNKLSRFINSLYNAADGEAAKPTLEEFQQWTLDMDNAYADPEKRIIRMKADDVFYYADNVLDNSKNTGFDIIDKPFSDYYTTFDKNINVDKNGITFQDLYNTLKNWNTAPSDEDEKKKDSFSEIAGKLWDAIEQTKFDNTKMRNSLENKIMPKGAVTSGDPNAEKTELKNILDDNPNGFGSVSAGTEYINKLMLMMYDYGMFTSQTSDKECDSDNMVKTIQPFSYQGIALAKSTGTDKYEASDTNFMLYGEMEYIFNGNADPKKNFNAVRNSLSMIRFVPNYMSTYTIKEINSIINSINTALAWCPLAAIAITQALRLAIAGFETWCDLDLLYGGHKVQFYKNSLGDLSLIKKITTTEAGNEVVKIFKDNFGVDLSKPGKKSIGNIEISYSQYLIILQMLFVSRDDMIKRTADLIDTNMNYIKSGAITNDDGKSTVSITYSLTKANTAVSATCTVKNNFIFIGGVMNTDAAGYENASQLAKDNENKTYNYTVMREY